jgi:uncharacterized lipoprotein YmbA
MFKQLCTAAALCVLLTACGSTPPSSFYMLSSEAKGSPSPDGPSIGVGPFTIPEYLNRAAMVLNRDKNRLQVDEFSRWAEPLDHGVSRVLALNLANILDTQRVQTYPWRQDNPPDYGVSLAIVQMSTHDNEALLVAKWTVRKISGDSTVVQRISRITTPSSMDPANTAAAYSQLLMLLSQEIAGVIKQQLTQQSAAADKP